MRGQQVVRTEVHEKQVKVIPLHQILMTATDAVANWKAQNGKAGDAQLGTKK